MTTTTQFQVGDKVKCYGFQGRIIKIGTGQLHGMVEVRLDRGVVCVSTDRVERVS